MALTVDALPCSAVFLPTSAELVSKRDTFVFFLLAREL